MLTLLSILLLVLIPLLIALMQFSMRRFRSTWLISAVVILVVWILFFAVHNEIPVKILLAAWQPVVLFSNSPALAIDQTSWSYAFTLISLGLAYLWTDVTRLANNHWRAWSGSLALMSAGLLAVFAGNPLTMLLFWVLVDGIELAILFYTQSAAPFTRTTALTYANRLVSIFVLLGTSMLATSQSVLLSWTELNQQWSSFLLVACGLRLIILPRAESHPSEQQSFGSFGTFLRFIPVISTLVLLTRIAQSGVLPSILPYLLWLAAVISLWNAIQWLRSPTAIQGSIYWIIGIAMMSLAAAAIAQPRASLAWSLCMLLCGGALFLYNPAHPRLRPLFSIGIFLFSGLPFSANWASAFFFTNLPWQLSILYWSVHIIFIIGYQKHVWSSSYPVDWPERWIWLIYPTGLAFPILSLIIINFLDPYFLEMITIPRIGYYWPGLITLTVLAVFYFLRRISRPLPVRLISFSNIQAKLDWLAAPFLVVNKFFSDLLHLTNQILEGEGGVLWTMVLLVLLLTLLTPAIRGG